MNKDFSKMSASEQQDLIKKIGDVINDCEIKGLTVDLQRQTVCVLNKEGAPEGKTILNVEKVCPTTDEAKVNKFKESIKTVIEGLQGVQVSVNCAIGAGCMYKTITKIVPIKESTPIDLVHKAGEVMLIDWWATWCPPCQGPMQHNQDMVSKRADWKGKAEIVGISIDKEKDTVVKHVDNKGWGSVTHYHRAESDCSKVYSVNGVPHVMLLDKFGKIAYKGHPSGCDLEKEIDRLIAQEEPSADEKKEETEEKEEKQEQGYKEGIDQAAIMKEMDDFTETATNMTKDDTVKEHAKKMVRAFCVLVLNSKYDPPTGKTSNTYENYRVLVGPQESIDLMKTAIEEKVKGSFEVVVREQAI